MRHLAAEVRKAHDIRLKTGFYDRFMSGNGLDVGYRGFNFDNAAPVLDSALGVDLGFPGYDGRTLPFPDESQDYVFASHVLEHIVDYLNALREWYRVTKIGGFIIICVPHQHLAERKVSMPSFTMEDHKRFYLPSSLFREIEEAYEVNSYRVEHMKDCDDNYDYTRKPNQIDAAFHWRDRFEIECVLRKIKKPDWELMP